MLKETDIHEGDILQWRGVNREVQGVALKDEDGVMRVHLNGSSTFSVKSLLRSKSLKVAGRVKIVK